MPRACPKCVENSQKKQEELNKEVLLQLERQYAKLDTSKSHSLLKKYLTLEMLNRLKHLKTSYGSTLLDCVASGFANYDSNIGVYAADVEAYTLFAELFDPIIFEYHYGFKPTDRQPNVFFGDPNELKELDPTNDYVISTRIRLSRSVDGYPFNPCMSEEHYKDIEELISSTVMGLTGDIEGKYFSYEEIPPQERHQLIDEHYLFGECDRFLLAANACRFFPTGRGIFYNKTKTFVVWCNEEDHLKLISMSRGSDIPAIYSRLIKGTSEIERRIHYTRHPRFGYVTLCPTNLGTTIRASVLIMLPNLHQTKNKLYSIAENFHLQVRGSMGEFTDARDAIYDISNKRRMGLTEFEAVRQMCQGVEEIIRIERSLRQ